MDEFFAALQPRLTAAVADEYRTILTQLPDQHVYAAAITHAGGVTWRVDLNTAESLESGLRDIGADDTGTIRELRWWPDEWQVIDSLSYQPATADLNDEVRRWATTNIDRTEDEATHDAFVQRMNTSLVTALGAAEVRSTFDRARAAPVLVVNDSDGDADSALASLDTLNRDHRDGEMVADARAFWSEI